MARGNLGDARVAFQAGDVVDDFGARGNGGFRDFKFLRVDRDGNFQAASKALQHGQDARQLFFGGSAARPRPRRCRADVDQVCARALHRQRVINGFLWREEIASIRKAVWRDVQHAHDERALAEVEGPGEAGQFQAECLAADHGSGEVYRREKSRRAGAPRYSTAQSRSKSRMGFSTGASLAFFMASSNFLVRMSSLFVSWNHESANLSSRCRCCSLKMPAALLRSTSGPFRGGSS